MNKMKEVMDVLGIKEGVPYDVIDTNDGHKIVYSPYTYNGDAFVDRDGDIPSGLLEYLIKGEYRIKPVIVYAIPKDTPKDTKVYVRDSKNAEWEPAYFAGFSKELGYPYNVYTYGNSSFTSPSGDTTCYKYCKLA